tara:strand:+ start:1278 stop:1907 length:630 start_codon:yes stop_codon:yes gene_type:complete
MWISAQHVKRKVNTITRFIWPGKHNLKLKQAMSIIGFDANGDRQKDDFYATPEPTTEALLHVEKFKGGVREPCCGEGHMSKVLIKHGYNVQSTDLVDRGYGQSRVDFLLETKTCDNIITNPPYKNALDFAEKSVQLATSKCALLLKLNFLEGVKRKEFFAVYPPETIYVFSQRQSLMKNGVSYQGGMMALAWYVWNLHAKPRQTVVKWL